LMRDPAYQILERRPKMRRGTFELRVEILKSLRHEPKRILRISTETSMCYMALKNNLDFMIGKGLVGTSRVPPRTKNARRNGVLVFLTRKGMIVLDRLEAAYNELIYAESHDEDLKSDEARMRGQSGAI